jgi:hypothetical protein
MTHENMHIRQDQKVKKKVRASAADPGSGAFLTSGSGMKKVFQTKFSGA